MDGEPDDDGLYGGPVFDAHHHLWDAATVPHPWLEAPGNADLRATGSAEAYRAAAGALDIVGSVWVEALAADPVAEIAWAHDTARRHPPLGAALVAHAPLDARDLESRLDALAAVAPNLRGIRDIVAVRPGEPGFARRPDLLTDDAFARGCHILARRGLVLDLMAEPWQAPAALALIDRVPDLHVALEHAGSPDLSSDDGAALWDRAMAAYAERPNVIVKISALHCRMPGWTDARLRDPIRRLVDRFGPDRLAVASDWPAHDRTVPMTRGFLTIRRAVRDLDPTAQRAMFHDTAQRLYAV